MAAQNHLRNCMDSHDTICVINQVQTNYQNNNDHHLLPCARKLQVDRQYIYSKSQINHRRRRNHAALGSLSLSRQQVLDLFQRISTPELASQTAGTGIKTCQKKFDLHGVVARRLTLMDERSIFQFILPKPEALANVPCPVRFLPASPPPTPGGQTRNAFDTGGVCCFCNDPTRLTKEDEGNQFK